jgi:hypothetical protein
MLGRRVMIAGEDGSVVGVEVGAFVRDCDDGVRVQTVGVGVGVVVVYRSM